MSANRPQMFRRKPVNLQQQLQQDKNESSLHTINKNKRLSYTNKIYQVNIYPSPMKKSFEESLTYSIDLTPINSSQKKKLQNYKMIEVRKHLYGIQDNMILNEEINEEQSLLLDYKQILDDGKKQRIEITPQTSCSQSQTKAHSEQQEVKQNICSNFQVYNTQYKLSFYHLNKNTVKVQYVPFKQQNDKKYNNNLVARMRLAFYKQPLLLFDFITGLAQDWNEQTLKMFLISISVKFTTQEIKSLHCLIRQRISGLSMHQIAQTLFILSNEQQQMLINSQKIKMSNLLPPQQNSFLKLYIAIIKENTTDNLRQILPFLESFFRKAI